LVRGLHYGQCAVGSNVHWLGKFEAKKIFGGENSAAQTYSAAKSTFSVNVIEMMLADS